MTKTRTWLLAGAALALCAGVAVAANSPQDAAREAQQDAAISAEVRAAVEESREAAREARERAREARGAGEDRAREAAERAREAGERAREAGERAREAGLEAARHARAYARHGDVVYFRGADRSDYLNRALELRPEQKPALDAFLEATRGGGRHETMVRVDRDRDDGKTTPQRLDDMQARLAVQQAEANRKIAAIRTFYGQLDARQRKAFDSMPMLMMVGPSMGPMMLPGPMPIVHALPPVPPVPPLPPLPPRS